jgi:hypothetical protein
MMFHRPLRFASALLLAVPAVAQTVGSPIINRPIDDSSSGLTYIYRGPTQPLAGPATANTWSFFDNENGNGKVTPLIFEVTGANQWKVVAIGTPRTTTGAGAQAHPFATQAGITTLQAGKQYTIGFVHRDYSFAAGVATPGANFGGVVDFTGYNIFTDTWSYISGTTNVGTTVGTGGLALDASGSAGRIYSMSVSFAPSAPVTYCTPGTTTTGCQAAMGTVGTPNVSLSSGFVLRAFNVEPNKQGLIFYGLSGRSDAPWAAGSTSFLCVKSPTQRLTAQSSGGTNGVCNGTFSIDWLAWLAANPTALGAPFSSGVTVNAQAWFRDPPAPKTTNLSNGVEFVTAP